MSDEGTAKGAEWSETPLGGYLVEREQRYFDNAVADIFGYNAFQVGLPEIDLLRGAVSRCGCGWVPTARSTCARIFGTSRSQATAPTSCCCRTSSNSPSTRTRYCVSGARADARSARRHLGVQPVQSVGLAACRSPRRALSVARPLHHPHAREGLAGAPGVRSDRRANGVLCAAVAPAEMAGALRRSWKLRASAGGP